MIFAKNIILDERLLDCVLPSEVELLVAAFLWCSAEGCYPQAMSPLLTTMPLLLALSAQPAAVF